MRIKSTLLFIALAVMLVCGVTVRVTEIIQKICSLKISD